MKKLFTFLVLLNFIFLFAQNQSRDVLHLKNGSIIKGSIIEMNPATGIKIKTADGSLFVYKMDEILKTEKETVSQNQEVQQQEASVSQLDLENVFRPYLNRNRPELNFIGISKVNGIKREFYGQKLYEIEYELLIEPTIDIHVHSGMPDSNGRFTSGEFLSNFSYYMGPDSASLQIDKGKRVLFTGSVAFEETDNGWRNGDFIPKDYKIVSSDYLTPDMKKRQEEEQAKIIAILKTELDWKKADIEPFNFQTKYLGTNNVPLFGQTHSKYSINKSTDYEGRSDILYQTQQTFYSALLNTNRFSEIEAAEFDNSQNSEVAEFNIKSAIFEFTETGYQCYLTLKAEIKGTYNTPSKVPFSYGLTIPARSSSYDKKMNKEQALSSALNELKTNLGYYVLKYKPITLELKEIVVDKRGKADKIIFKKPEKFIATERIEFIIHNTNDLSTNNSALATTPNVIGDCLFKGEIIGDEIICEVRGNKNKKELINYLDKTDNLIGISTN